VYMDMDDVHFLLLRAILLSFASWIQQKRPGLQNLISNFSTTVRG
jgi:hypothetical protein